MPADKLETMLREQLAADEPQPAPETPAPAGSGDSGAGAAPGMVPAATPAPTDDDDADPPEAQPGEPSVPRHALVDERQKRRDWKEKAARLEGEAAELRKRLEALEQARQQPQQPEPPPFQFTDPAVDPQRAIQEQLQNHMFHVSEMMIRQRLGDEAVDQTLREFQTLASQDRTLWDRVRQQRDPWAWAHSEVQRQKMLQEVGSDPSAYEAKLRAKWEAERAAQTPTGPANTPPPPMPQSLAGARSVAGRSAPAWSGPPSDADAIAAIRASRMAGRANGR